MDTKCCLVVLLVVIVALYIIFEIRHWVFKRQGFLQQLQICQNRQWRRLDDRWLEEECSANDNRYKGKHTDRVQRRP